MITVQALAGGEIRQTPAYQSAAAKQAQREPEKKPFTLPWARRCATAAVSYLQRRGISSDVISRCFRNGLFYEARYQDVYKRQIFDNRIPIHQAHSYCHCESMSHISGCATICIAGSDKQSAITGGWLPPRRRPAIGLTILPSSHSPSVISGISTAKPSQAMGAVAREPREGEIPVEPTAIGRLMTSQ